MFLLFSVLPASAENRGIPFIHNFLATEYNAHNRNFDVACDDFGSVYFANFEGILYYDGASWRKIHSPGNSRITRIVWDKDRKCIWFGGFNIFGYLEPDDMGRMQMRLIASDISSKGKRTGIGEVDFICLYNRQIFVSVTDGKVYKVSLNHKPYSLNIYKGKTNFINRDMRTVSLGYTKGLNLSFDSGKGLLVKDATRSRVIDETDGLCSNNVNFVMFDRKHTVWGATDHGIFAIEMPSPFSHITEGQGLNGEVYSIAQLENTIYVGTLQGLYRIDNGKVTHVPGINLACWQLTKDGNSLLASTTTGVYRITPTRIKQIETSYSFSTIPAPWGGYYTAEEDSIYYVPNEDDDVHYTKIANIEKATKMKIVGKTLCVETINGQQWNISLNPPYKKKCVRSSVDVNEPKIQYTDALGRRWETDEQGKDLAILSSNKNISTWIHPLTTRALNAIYCGKENSLWVGGDFGVINCDLSLVHNIKVDSQSEPVYIRQITIMGDSVIWGGYTKDGYRPKSQLSGFTLPSDCHNLIVYFSSRYQSFVNPTQYRYRINGGHWSAWDTYTYAEFNNMKYGDTDFEVEAMDLFGIVTTAHVSWYVEYPFYMRWWAVLIYLFILANIGRAIAHYRMKKLQRDKEHLEEVVNERTSELSSALDELKKTQEELVHAERTATAGKLTQGLIDRILNPLNYINNFSKLTSGLAKDLKEDIEDEKENMTEDNYEDCEDILNMMDQNLTKIEEHGVNTTRTLRAMEAMLNQQTGSLRPTDLSALCHQIAEVISENYKEVISKNGISFSADIAEGITHDVDPESLTDVLKALLSNAFYAVEKRLRQTPYDNPEVKLSLIPNPSTLNLVIHDNGIGIEETIIDKVFDPFFTTKPTGEASGVGLYLAREVIQDHKGTITVDSEKENHTDFIITL